MKSKWELARTARDILKASEDGGATAAAYVSEGCSRRVYRDGDHVFKISKFGDHDANQSEYANWKRLLTVDLPDNVFMPSMMLVEIVNRDETHYVIVSDFVDGTNSEYASEYEVGGLLNTLEDVTGLTDLWADNVLVKDNGEVWLVDLEC